MLANVIGVNCGTEKNVYQLTYRSEPINTMQNKWVHCSVKWSLVFHFVLWSEVCIFTQLFVIYHLNICTHPTVIMALHGWRYLQ